jgi:hypothetical protein
MGHRLTSAVLCFFFLFVTDAVLSWSSLSGAPATTSSTPYTWTRHHLILNFLDDVVSRLEVLTPVAAGDWKRQPLAVAPGSAALTWWAPTRTTAMGTGSA